MNARGLIAGTLAVLALPGCGGGSSGASEQMPSISAVRSCLQKAGTHPQLAQSGGALHEVVAITPDEALIYVFQFSDGGEGNEAVEKLESEPGGEGMRHVHTAYGGRMVVSLSHGPTKADYQLASRCAG